MIVPTLDTAREALRGAEAEQAFWAEHAADLVRAYPDQFVAVYDGQVVAASENLMEAVEQLQAKGLAPRDVWLKFMATDPRRLLL